MSRCLVVPLALVALFAGCAQNSSSESASGEKVAWLMKRDIARAFLSENNEPTEAQIDEAARKLDASCERTTRRDFACVTHYGEELGDRHCTVRPNPGLTKLESTRCGAGSAPVTHSGYTDCSTIARMVIRVDPPGDVRRNWIPRSRPGSRVEDDRSDLRSARVAASDDRLCVEWETAAATSPPYSRSIVTALQNPDRDRPTYDMVDLSVSFETGQEPDVSTGPYGSVTARIGTRGRYTSVLVERGDLAEPLREAFGEPFTWSIHSGRGLRGGKDRAYIDELDHEPAARPRYP
jgi:hypothetical protein